MDLKSKLSLDKLQDSENIAKLLSKEDLSTIGLHVKGTYEQDKSSRSKWETKMEDATELALQVSQQKTYPWPNL
jgi:hypothetical protein